MTIEGGAIVKLIVETEKRGVMTCNLEVETKVLEIVDKRGVSDGVSAG